MERPWTVASPGRGRWAGRGSVTLAGRARAREVAAFAAARAKLAAWDTRDCGAGWDRARTERAMSLNRWVADVATWIAVCRRGAFGVGSSAREGWDGWDGIRISRAASAGTPRTERSRGADQRPGLP